MKLIGKVPVESLDEERLTNIERKLVVQVSEMSQRPMRAPSRLFAYAAIAAAVGVALLVGYRLRGHAQVAAPAPQQYAVKDGALDLGDAQITGKDFSVVRFGTRVEVALDKPGKLDFHVEHKPGRLFVVHAGNVEIEDVGTRFTVDYDGTNVDVQVTEGAVKVKHAGKELEVAAGNAWTIELGPITIAQLQQHATQVALNTVQTAPQPSTTSQTVTQTPAASNGGTSRSASGSNSGSGEGSGHRHPAGPPDGKKALDGWFAKVQPLLASTEKDPTAAANDYVRRTQDLPEGEEKATLLQSVAVMQLRTKNLDGAKLALKGILHERQGAGSWDTWPAYKSALFLDVRIKCVQSWEADANRDGKPDKTFDDSCRIAAEKYLAKYPDGYESGIAKQVLDEI